MGGSQPGRDTWGQASDGGPWVVALEWCLFGYSVSSSGKGAGERVPPPVQWGIPWVWRSGAQEVPGTGSGCAEAVGV